MKNSDKIFIAFHQGMIGAAILRRLKKAGYHKLLIKTSAEVDMTNQEAVNIFFQVNKPDYVFLPSARVGGILANNQYPAEFIYTNLVCQTNIVHSSWKSGVKKLLFLASSCIYPKDCPQPMKEKYLLSGQLEVTSEPYALAKIAGIKMCQSYNRQYRTNFISVVPADAYGPDDDFNPETAHVLPAVISKIHTAKMENDPEVIIWGTGSPRRETLHVDDLADACVFLMENYDSSEIINIGSGRDISIKDLAQLIKSVIGYQGNIKFDASKPDGMPRKLLDISRLSRLGWSPKISLEKGIRETYRWYEHHAIGRQQRGK